VGEQRFGRSAVEHVAARQQRQRAEACAALDEASPRRIGQQLGGVAHQQLAIDAGNERRNERALSGHDDTSVSGR